MNIQKRILGAPRANLRMDAGGKRTIYGYASVFYNGQDGTEYDLYGDGWMMERIMPGAFDRAIREDDVRALFNHDVNHILGRSLAGTLRLSVDSVGLRYEIDPPASATALIEALERGDVSGSSFSFLVTDSQVVKKNGQRVFEVTGVQLFDVGPVTFPAYTGASSAVRASGGGADLELRQRIEGEELAARLRLRERELRLKAVS